MDSPPKPAEIAPLALALEGASLTAERVRAWWDRAQRVYPANTLRAWHFDWALFIPFCESLAATPLPASAEIVAAFVEAQGRPAKIPRRSAGTFRRLRLPTASPNFPAPALKKPCSSRCARSSARQRQARALGWAEIKQFLERAGDSLPATRERALVCVAYDTMARRSEFVALNVEDLWTSCPTAPGARSSGARKPTRWRRVVRRTLRALLTAA